MSSSYTGQAANAVDHIDLPTDEMPQRATTYNPPMQQLEDQYALLTAMTRGRIGSVATMLALTGVTEGSYFVVPEYGLFAYTTSAQIAHTPWAIYATGMGAGFWVNTVLRNILNGVPTQFIPHGIAWATSPTVADYRTVVGSAAVRDSLGSDLSFSISPGTVGVGAIGDQLEIDTCPFLCWQVNQAAAKLFLMLSIAQETSSGRIVTLYELRIGASSSEGAPQPCQFHVAYELLAGTQIDVALSVVGDGVATIHCNGPSSAYPGNGNLQWASWKLIRVLG
jgi:hypothetical protein